MIRALLPTCLALFVGGCSTTDALYTAGGATAGGAAGALVGTQVSDNPVAPIIGAASGAALGGLGTALAINTVKSGQKKEFQKGYDRGAADAVKRQYWILQNQQRGSADADFELTTYRFTIPPDPDSDVNRVPYEIEIPIYR